MIWVWGEVGGGALPVTVASWRNRVGEEGCNVPFTGLENRASDRRIVSRDEMGPSLSYPWLPWLGPHGGLHVSHLTVRNESRKALARNAGVPVRFQVRIRSRVGLGRGKASEREGAGKDEGTLRSNLPLPLPKFFFSPQSYSRTNLAWNERLQRRLTKHRLFHASAFVRCKTLPGHQRSMPMAES